MVLGEGIRRRNTKLREPCHEFTRTIANKSYMYTNIVQLHPLALPVAFTGPAVALLHSSCYVLLLLFC